MVEYININFMKSGYVSLVGRPSVGKSTLVNTIIGEKVSIISKIPQTTRKQIRGIYTDSDSQIVFLDTPGWHKSTKKFNTHLINEIHKSINDSDIILYVIDITRKWGEEESEIKSILSSVDKKPVIVVLNKIDLVDSSIAKKIKYFYGKVNELKHVLLLPVSASISENILILINSIKDLLKEGPKYYPDDFYTDQNVGLRISEIIREQVFLFTKEDLPHSVYISIEDIEDKKNVLVISAYINVEKESQKSIIIGKKGELIKKIGINSRENLEQIFDKKIHLDLKVKVKKKWRKDDVIIKSMF